MRLFYIYFLIFFLVCGCCVQITEPGKEEIPPQKTLQVATDWETLATDLANRINNQLIITGNLDKAVFVKETCGDENLACQPNETSSFNEAFHDLLVTYIHGYGVPTESQPEKNAIEVHYKVQIIRVNTDRPDSDKVDRNCEVVITTSMVTKGQYIFRASDIYFIKEKDFFHYQENMLPTKTIKLSNGKIDNPIPGWEVWPTNTTQKISSSETSVYKTDV